MLRSHGFFADLNIVIGQRLDVHRRGEEVVHKSDAAPTIARILGVTPDATVQRRRVDKLFKQGHSSIPSRTRGGPRICHRLMSTQRTERRGRASFFALFLREVGFSPSNAFERIASRSDSRQ